MAKRKSGIASVTGKTRDVLAKASGSAKPPTAKSKSLGVPRNRRGQTLKRK